MELLLYTGVFALGLLMGSFLNVVVLRYHTGKGIGGRSACFSCGEQLTYLDLVPVLSFIFLRGRCRHCESRISFQYPFVEVLSGFLFLFVYITAGSLIEFIGMAAVFWLLLGIAVYDLRHKIIPDHFVYAVSVCALLMLFFDPVRQMATTPSLEALMAGPLTAFPLWLLWFVSRGRWIGLGDAKLALGIGWLLGVWGGVTVLAFSFWIGAVVSLILLGLHKLLQKTQLHVQLRHITTKTEIPFAPFLIVSTILVYVFHLNLVTFLTW